MNQDRFHFPKYRPDIDGLRALAVLSVVVFHAFPDSMPGGFIGVDIFFVISGFLISTIIFENLDKGTFRFSDFYARRIKRIFPALLLVLFSCFIFGWFVLLTDEYEQLGKHITAAAGFVSNFVFWSEAGYFDNAAETKPLLHLWSLGIEEQFYIVWPLILWLVWKSRFNRLSTVVLLAVISFVWNLVSLQSDSVAAFYSPLTRFWELLFGSILAWCTLYNKDTFYAIKKKVDNWLAHILYRKNTIKYSTNYQIVSNILSVVGLLLFSCGFWLIDKDSYFPGAWALIPVLGAVFVISAGSQAWINRTILSHKIVVWFGLISYPLYLWHWPLLSFARIVWGETPDPSIRIGLVLISILLAWLTYSFIERPIRHGGKNQTKVIILSSGCLLILFLVLLSYQTKWIVPRPLLKAKGGSSLAKFDQILLQNPDHKKQLDVNRHLAIRSHVCHFFDEDSFEEYRTNSDQCLKVISDKLNIMIIGDSLAADLYQALKATHKDVNFLQATAAGCFVIQSVYIGKRGKCGQFFAYAFDFVSKNEVDYVVLASRWPKNFEGVKSEIAQLKESHVKIFLTGPAPEFKEDVYTFIARRSSHDDLQSLSIKNFKFEKIALNERMKIFAQSQDVHFLDRLSSFCNTDGICKLMDDNANLYISDFGHLTRTGAQFWGNKLFESGYFR